MADHVKRCCASPSESLVYENIHSLWITRFPQISLWATAIISKGITRSIQQIVRLQFKNHYNNYPKYPQEISIHCKFRLDAIMGNRIFLCVDKGSVKKEVEKIKCRKWDPYTYLITIEPNIFPQHNSYTSCVWDVGVNVYIYLYIRLIHSILYVYPCFEFSKNVIRISIKHDATYWKWDPFCDTDI